MNIIGSRDIIGLIKGSLLLKRDQIGIIAYNLWAHIANELNLKPLLASMK